MYCKKCFNIYFLYKVKKVYSEYVWTGGIHDINQGCVQNQVLLSRNSRTPVVASFYIMVVVNYCCDKFIFLSIYIFYCQILMSFFLLIVNYEHIKFFSNNVALNLCKGI